LGHASYYRQDYESAPGVHLLLASALASLDFPQADSGSTLRFLKLDRKATLL
jgi:hypothetical protein